MRSPSLDPLTAPRESSWADVEAAQEIARRRLMPRWWTGLAWSLLIGCAVALLVSSSDRTWLYFALVVAALCANSWEQSLRGVEPRVSVLPTVQLVTCTVIFVALAVGGIWLVIALDDLPPSAAVLAGLISGGVLWASQAIFELLLARSMRTAGHRRTRQRRAGGDSSDFDGPSALQAAVVLHCVGSMSESTLARDLNLAPGETEQLLEHLAEQHLVRRRRHSWDPTDRRWASLTPAGRRCLETHLAAMGTTTGGTV